MVKVSLPEQLYTKLLKRVRHCRLYFDDPALPERVVGKAVWIQPSPGSDVRIGLFFEDCPEPTTEKLRQFLESFAASKP